MVEDSSHTDVCPVSSPSGASRELVEAVRGLIKAADVFASMRVCWSAGLHDAGSPVSSMKEIAVNHSAVFQIGAAIERANAALANTPGWRDIDEKAKKLKRVDLCGYYPSTKHGPRLKRIPDCYWHKNAGVWRCDHYDRDGFRQLRANFVITHYREIDALPQPPEVK